MPKDDQQLFLDTIGATRGEVRKLKPHGKALLCPPRKAPRLLPRSSLSGHLPSEAEKPIWFSDHDPYPAENQPNEHGLPAQTLFQRACVPAQTLRRLRQGKLRLDRNLDLHGCTSEQAKQRLGLLLQQPALERYPGEPLCVRIVHGMGMHSPHGQSKLKHMLHIWLPQSERVLAFCPARANDGGAGAMYVLLRAEP